jgi:hypothetical protein
MKETAATRDLLASREENGKAYSLEDEGKNILKGAFFGVLISLPLWFIFIALLMVIF